jgi:DNA excision repair protein ERCC-2
MTEGFPYVPRKNQDLLLDLVMCTLDDGAHLVVESGTGTGKTVCALAPAVDAAKRAGKKVLYLTHTNSQQHQVILELRRIKETRGEEGLFGIGLQGRVNMCPLTEENEEFKSGNSEELSKLCSDRRRGSQEYMKEGRTRRSRCIYYEKNQKMDFHSLLGWCKNVLPTAEEFIAHCHGQGTCPYMLTSRLMQYADVVTAPYIYFFNSHIQRRLLEWMGVPSPDVIVIVDEAHNLGEFARELASADLSMVSLEMALRETRDFGDKVLLDNATLRDFLETLMLIIQHLKETYITEQGQEDSLIMSPDLNVEILSRFKINSIRLQRLLEDVIIYGENVQETRRAQNRLARSYVHSVGTFLLFWMGLEEGEYARLVCNDPSGENTRIEAYCLNPALVTHVVNDCFASVHMSGTLRPLEEYRDSIGLTYDTQMALVESPFPPEHLSKFFLQDVTTRYEDLRRDQDMFSRIFDNLVKIIQSQDRNTAIFFPSFALMNKMLDMGLLLNVNRKTHTDMRGMKQKELMSLVEDFKGGQGQLLLSVIGGRVSEGMDFPGDALEVVALVGIPYPKPTARQQAVLDYYDKRFRKGWEYAVKAPTTRKMLQAIGRIVRNEEDRGVAVILDYRARQFSSYIPDLSMSWDIEQDISQFFTP